MSILHLASLKFLELLNLFNGIGIATEPDRS